MGKQTLIIVIVGIFMLIQSMRAQSWETTKRLTWTPETSASPDMALDSSDNIHLIWVDEAPGNPEIFYKKSSDGGVSWSTKRLTWNAGVSHGPTIITDSINNIHVAWFDWTPGNCEIYYKRSTNEGATWDSPCRLTWNTGSSNFPSIGIDSINNMHLVWHDESSGNFEIYYKKGIQ